MLTSTDTCYRPVWQPLGRLRRRPEAGEPRTVWDTGTVLGQGCCGGKATGHRLSEDCGRLGGWEQRTLAGDSSRRLLSPEEVAEEQQGAGAGVSEKQGAPG